MKLRHTAVIVVGTAVLAAGLSQLPRPQTQIIGLSPAPAAVRLQQCRSVGGLPDRNCTPGAVSLQVTQDNIKQTICAPGYTKTVRPPTSLTNSIKQRQIVNYGAYAGTDVRGYELDHLVSLELGGAPADERNLWPQAYLPAPGAHEKDAVENWLHQAVCAETLTLSEAQSRISTNWLQIYMSLPLSSRGHVGEGAGEGQ